MNYLLVMPKGASKSSGGYNVFAVGIAYVSASLKQAGFNVFTINLEFCQGDTFNALLGKINSNSIDVICTSGLSRDYPKVKEIIDYARRIKPSILTVVGGGIVTSDPEHAMLALDADIGVIGEGEVTLCELAHALESGSSYHSVPGLIIKNEEQKYTITGARSEIPDIDSIPLPDYDGFSFSDYMESIHNEVAYVIGSRSCPFSCTFCFHPSGKKYRQRSLDNMFKEIEYLIDKYKVKFLTISDELFASDRNRVIEFSRRMSKFNVLWSLQLRVPDVDPEMLAIMSKANCRCISYGIESADNSILKSMRKGITVEQIEYALKITHDANIEIQGGFIFGDIAETPDTAQKTLKWHSDHPEYGLELNMIQIFPGTRIYEHAVNRGIIQDRIKYLKGGCPQVNVSRLTDEQYRDLSSLLYEKNMRAKYPPRIYELEPRDSGKFNITFKCNRCGTSGAVETDALHITRTGCAHCSQRHYVDPFAKLDHSEQSMRETFDRFDKIAIWGAGEICIKLLDTYETFRNDKFRVVDISGSRQGYSVCGKPISSPEIIRSENISTILIAVVNRKDEVLKVLDLYTMVKNVFIPDLVAKNLSAAMTMKRL